MGNLPQSLKLAVMGATLVLAGCELTPMGGGGLDGPPNYMRALEALALDFERTSFSHQTRVAGAAALAQQRGHIATPTQGRLRAEAVGPIPTEVKVELTSLVTRGNTVTMRGTLILRDLSFGTVLAKKENFSASGPFGGGAYQLGDVFRGVEDEIIDWIATLDCETTGRICGVDLAPAAANTVISAPIEPGDALDLDDMVVNRPGGSLTKLIGGAISAEQVIAASTPSPDAEPVITGGTQRLGSTVAALGLLSRAGFWLQTPLVSAETPGEVRDPATGRSLPVTLIPKDGPVGGGSQISLAALNELGLDATALVTLEVFR